MTQVLRSLEAFCAALQPGDVVPPRAELMRRFGASERAVRWALDELRRQGKILQRRGAGTFVAEPNVPPPTRPVLPSAMTDSRTVVAIAEPDHAVFERAMNLLFRHVAAADLSLACRLVDPDTESLPIPRPEESGSGNHPLGYVMLGRVLLPLAEQFHAAGNRTVLVGTPFAQTTPNVPTVQGDQEIGGYLATRHLLELGHRHIAYYGYSDVALTRRWRGHQAALAEARKRGVTVQDRVLFLQEYERWCRAPQEARAYFSGPEAPTGIVAWNDHEAVLLLSLLSYVGVRVPDDVSLVGYDNLPEGQRVHPPLTTVEGAIEQQLQAALSLLTRPLAPSPSHTVVVLPTLIARDSTAPPRGKQG